MLPMRFERTTPAGERPQTYAWDHAATETGLQNLTTLFMYRMSDKQFAITREMTACVFRGQIQPLALDAVDL